MAIIVAMTRYCLIGPTYPYRGGIAHYTTLLARHLRQAHDVLLLSFSRQYPAWLFPGRSDKDPSERPLRTEAEFLLDPINPLTWRRTLRRVRDWRPDVVIMQWWHPYFTPAWAVLGRAIKRLTPAPRLLFICHNVLPHEQGGRLGQRVQPLALRLALAAADHAFVHAAADGEILRRFLPQLAYTVTPHPTYEALGRSENGMLPVTLPQDRPLLLFCGFVRPYKGLDVLLEALPQVLAKRRVHLLAAGEFWQGGAALYQRQIEKLGIGAHVTLLDAYLPDEQLAAVMGRADVVVLPYRSATQSGVVQMAFGYQKPVITTDVGGLAEAVADGRTGLIVPPEDAPALAQAIERFFAEGLGPQMVERIVGENGRFSWERLVKTVETAVVESKRQAAF